MPDLLNLSTDDWTLGVWSADISQAGKRLTETLSARGRAAAKGRIRVEPAKWNSCSPAAEYADGELLLAAPIFFENRGYEFEFSFNCDVEFAEVRHRLTSVCDAFRFTGNSLRGSINTGNDIGWLRLALHYQYKGHWQIATVCMEVLPVKMVMEDDLHAINEKIDASYPLWRFTLATKTSHELALSRKSHERFSLLWLAQFSSLREQLQKEVRYICNAPHSRLSEFSRSVRTDRLRGKFGHRLEERLSEKLHVNDLHSRHRVGSRKLSVDTTENRFIRMVLIQCERSLSAFARNAKKHNTSPEHERISQCFIAELLLWQRQISGNLGHTLFSEVGEFDGMEGESLVLHQRAGYAGVYRIWQQLKLYLDLFGRQASISVKPVSELYEV